jgi:hypothetical protein
MKLLYVEMDDGLRRELDRLAAEAGAAVGHRVTVKEVVEQLVRDASERSKPIRIRGKGA